MYHRTFFYTRSAAKATFLPHKYLSSLTGPTSSGSRKKIEATLSDNIESINRITGLSTGKLNELKKVVQDNEINFNKSKKQLIEFRKKYENAVQERSQTQGEINILLQRKNEWNATDVERFSEICKKEHTSKESEKVAKQKCVDQEMLVDAQQNNFLQSLRLVYSEENMLAHKIRVVNTYVTWGLIALNTSIFLISTLLIEPNKRQQFEERVQQVVAIENQKSSELVLNSIEILKEDIITTNSSTEATSKIIKPTTGGHEINVNKTKETAIVNSNNNDGTGIVNVTSDQVGAFCLGALSVLILSAFVS
jgi:hypothetical protein